MIKQTQQLKLQQRLSPQQIQLMKLLQVPTVQLETRIKEELEENPALEYGTLQSSEEDDPYNKKEESTEASDENVDLTDDYAENVNLDDYLKSESADHNYDYDYTNEDYYNGQEINTPPVILERTFHETLMDQLSNLALGEHALKIATQIIGSISDDGYLRRELEAINDDLSFTQNVHTNLTELKHILELIQQFDPPGVGARSLQECLLLQAKRSAKTHESLLAVKVLEKHFDDFSKKHFEKIQKALNISDAELKRVINFILKFNPKPGSALGDEAISTYYVIPDFFVTNNNGNLNVSLNSKNAPELRVSDNYKEMLSNFEKQKVTSKKQKETVLFIKHKLDAAKWFIDAIKKRQHTLLDTMEAIVTYQKEFFLSGDDTTLKPMILKDIAQMTNLDLSTVSRVANSKFVQTEFGTYLLKHFFSESLQTESGEEVSTREVKSILSGIIASENKSRPYPDEELMDMLAAQGYQIARRTIAKYREQLKIPVARMRKEV